MLDRKYIVDHVEQVRVNCQNRGVDVDLDQLLTLETRRRDLLNQVQELNRQANEVSKSIGKAKTPEAREAAKEEGRRLRQQKDDTQAEHDRVDLEVLDLQLQIPNLTHPDAPVGGEDAKREVRRGACEPATFDFPTQDHVEIGERLGLIDFEAGARVAGNGFYFLRNEGALLELALQQFAVHLLRGEGFQPIITPDLAYSKILQGIGFMPRGPETQIYSIENTELNLVATAEITLGGMFSGQVLDADDLPMRFCGISHCFRTEAGAAGRASRGLYRVHQFTKVEMFAFTRPEQCEPLHEEICALECRIFDELELPYRVVDTATGDLGAPAYRKYDLEAWMPGRGDGGEWGEVTSTSNCTDYQARRLNVRYKEKGQKGTQFAHTLNGTAVAISRAILAILENNQQADGSIRIPKALQHWMNAERIAPAS